MTIKEAKRELCKLYIDKKGKTKHALKIAIMMMDCHRHYMYDLEKGLKSNRVEMLSNVFSEQERIRGVHNEEGE